jgi:hypothetical protein
LRSLQNWTFRALQQRSPGPLAGDQIGDMRAADVARTDNETG